MPSKTGGAAVMRGRAVTKMTSGIGQRPASGSRLQTAITRASEVASGEGSTTARTAEATARSGLATGPIRSATNVVFRRRGGTAGTSSGRTPMKGQAAT